MNTSRAFLLLLSFLLFTGCAQSSRSVSSGVQPWTRSLSAEERAHCKQVALEAAASPEMLKRFKLKRISSEPLNLEERGIECHLDQKHFDKVEVTVPSGGQVGWHSTYIGVMVARGTYDVLDMYESFWP